MYKDYQVDHRMQQININKENENFIEKYITEYFFIFLFCTYIICKCV